MSTATINSLHNKNNTCFPPNYFARRKQQQQQQQQKVKNSGHEKEAILP